VRPRALGLALAVAFLGLGPAALAQSVRLSIDRPEMSMEDQAVVTAVVEGAGRAEPKIPANPKLNVEFAGRSENMSIVNGRFSHSVAFRWVVMPREVGQFEIGPAEIEVDGKVYRSETVKLDVVAASEKPRSARPVFVTATVSDDHPFVGEQVIFVWRFYRRARIADPRLDSLELGGFVVEDLGDPQNPVAQLNVIEGGVEYEVSEIRKALFAQRPGTIVIAPSQLVVQVVQSTRPRRGIDPFDGVSSPFDEFFGRMRTETVHLSTAPITVNVRALPAAPDGFSGLVGSFDVDASLSSTRVAVGESLTQKVDVEGSGNIRMLGDLPLADPDGFKIYRDQPQSSIERTPNGVVGKKTFSRALVPVAAGSFAIPETRLVYFDPTREEYRTASVPAVTIEVRPGSTEETALTESLEPVGGKVPVSILDNDLQPIHGGPEILARPMSGAVLSLLLAFPPLAFLGLVIARRRADRLATDVGWRRRRGALRTAMSTLGRREEVPPRDASGILRRYIGDRVAAAGQALTPRECVDRLGALGASEPLLADVHGLLERVEAADYGGGDASPIAASELRSILERLERELQAPARGRER